MERSSSSIKYIRTGSPWEEGPVRRELVTEDVIQLAIEFLKKPSDESARRKEFIENMNA